ncbi:MAG: hypothetical protein KBA60_03455 [Flavobacteriales bacterium]|nr:hypothetical protein [Flavobacteriales bacterium]
MALLLLMHGCRKDPGLDGFVPGEIIFSLQLGKSFVETYDLIDRHDLELKEGLGFVYEVDSTIASLDSVRTVFATKAYLTNGGRTFGIFQIEHGAYVSTNFFAFDQADHLDWVVTVAQLGLIERPELEDWKWGILGVPIGTENAWVRRLREEPIIKAVQLNHYI